MTAKVPQINFKHVIETNICLALKRAGGQMQRSEVHKAINESVIVTEAFVKTLKNRGYVTVDDDNVYLDLYIYEKLML